MFDIQELLGLKDRNSRDQYLKQMIWEAVSQAKTMDEVLEKGLRRFFESTFPKQTASDFCAIVKRFPLYTYNPDSYRRSFRSTIPADYYNKIVQLVWEFNFDWKNFDLLNWLTMSDAQKQDKDYKCPDSLTLSMLIALKIDSNEKEIINAVTDIILSETNNRAISHELIRAVAMSHNTVLYDLMQKMLLAAKLQEGLRQAILETADDGTLDYFKLTIKTMLENDLLRFSSALRSVCVWMGLGYDYSDKRNVEKLLRLSYEYIEDELKRSAAMGSADITQMYAGMWAESVFSIQNLNTHIEKYLHGQKYQKMVGAYFLYETGNQERCLSLAGGALDEADLDVLTFILKNYSLKFQDISNNYWNRKNEDAEIDINKYPEFLKDKSIRDRHFTRLAEILETIPKNGHELNGKPFDWCYLKLTRTAVFETMMVLAVYDFELSPYDYDSEKLQRLVKLLPFSESNNRCDLLDYFISRDINAQNKIFLFDCLSDKSMPVRLRAVNLLKRVKLTEVELLKVEELLALKTGEIRQSALEVIRNAGNLLPTTKRLIVDKNENKRLAALDLLSTIKKSGAISDEGIQELFASMPEPTEAETIIMNSLLSEGLEYSAKNGFGLYNPDYYPSFPPAEPDKKYDLKTFRKISAKDLMLVFDSLLALIEEHKDYEYKALYAYGGQDYYIFGNNNWLHRVTNNREREDLIEDYVLGETWRTWFEKNQANLLIIYKILFCREGGAYYFNSGRLEYKPFALSLIKKLLGLEEAVEFIKQAEKKKYCHLAFSIIDKLLDLTADKFEMFTICSCFLEDFFLGAPYDDWSEHCYETIGGYYFNESKLANMNEVTFFIKHLKAGSDEELKKKLALCYDIGKASKNRYIALKIEDIAHAAQNDFLEKGELRRAIMEINNGNNIESYTRVHVKDLYGPGKYPSFLESVQEVVKRVIEIELQRGDTKTPVSHLVLAVSRHEGAEVLRRSSRRLAKRRLSAGISGPKLLQNARCFPACLKPAFPPKTMTHKR